MQDIRKLAKNPKWLLDTVKLAPQKVKQKRKQQGDDTKIDRQYFSDILDYISEKVNIPPPSPQEKHQLFEEFNQGKNQAYINKDEYETFQNRIALMLTIILN